MANAENVAGLDSILDLMRVSPGSTIVLRGHVDNALVPSFRQSGGESLVRTQALKAMQLSQERANEVMRRLVERNPQIDKSRLQAFGRGWDEPVSEKSDENRRVEVQWFLVE